MSEQEKTQEKDLIDLQEFEKKDKNVYLGFDMTAPVELFPFETQVKHIQRDMDLRKSPPEEGFIRDPQITRQLINAWRGLLS